MQMEMFHYVIIFANSLDWAVVNNQPSIVKILTQLESIDCSIKNYRENTALDEAINMEYWELAELIAPKTKATPESEEIEENKENEDAAKKKLNPVESIYSDLHRELE